MNHQSEQTAKLVRLQQSIRARKGLVGCGMGFSVALHHSGRVLYTGENRWGQGDIANARAVTSVVCGQDYVVARLEDGTLYKTGRHGAEDAFFKGLSCVRRVACGAHHTAALLGNGRVLVAGDDRYGQCHTSDWTPVTDICCGERFTAGLTEDGRVQVCGGTRVLRHTARSWKQVAGLFTDYEGKHLYAINANGVLLSTTPLPFRAERWRNLVYIAASGRHLWGVTASGQLLSTNSDVRRVTAKDAYVACAAGDRHALALTKDGHVRAVGNNAFGQIETWGFGSIFRSFEELSAERRSAEHRLDITERNYQVHLTAAHRYHRHLVCGERMTVGLTADGRVLTTVGYGARRQWSHVRTLACGNAHMLALHTDGHVSADGNDVEGCCAVSDWTGVKSVVAGQYHSLGLTEEGTVYFGGSNRYGQGNVQEWKSIRMIRTSDRYTVGVTYDGHILLCGTPPFDPTCITDAWDAPIDIILTETHMAALYADGHVLTTLPSHEESGKSLDFVCDTAKWRNVRSIAAGEGFTVGLCYGGTVLSTGRNDCGQCNVSEWRHVTYIACGRAFTAALNADGALLCTGHIARDRTATGVDEPTKTIYSTGLIAMTAGREHLVVLSRDGRVHARGIDVDGRCSAANHFVLFRDARQLYGYGNYRKMAEENIPTSTDDESRADPIVASDPVVTATDAAAPVSTP